MIGPDSIGPDSDDGTTVTPFVAPTLPTTRPGHYNEPIFGPGEPAEEPVRPPRLWLPLTVFLVLLAAAGSVGKFVVPAGAPNPGTVPNTAVALPTGASTAAPATPDVILPTPPARPADALAAWAGRVADAVSIPSVAVQAYGYAHLLTQRTNPNCHLSWTTLAGVGEVESKHGQAGGAVLAPNGRPTPMVTEPLLDGKGGRALVRDTDAGAFDDSATYDRAMGPLHLTPTVWRQYAVDADADGIQDPYDVDDAALALARLLCGGGDDLGQRSGWNAAIARYHSGVAYGRTVFDAADRYGRLTQSIR